MLSRLEVNMVGEGATTGRPGEDTNGKAPQGPFFNRGQTEPVQPISRRYGWAAGARDLPPRPYTPLRMITF